MNLTIDSSIFVEYVLKGIHQTLCEELIKSVYENNKVVLYEPGIILFEFVNAVDRGTGDPNDRKKRIKQAQIICTVFIEREKSYFQNINLSLWKEWTKSHKKKSAHKTQDELFIFTAYKNDSFLVSLDKKMMEKPQCLSGQCKTLSPYDCLQNIKSLK